MRCSHGRTRRALSRCKETLDSNTCRLSFQAYVFSRCVSERILYPRNTKALPKVPVVGGQPIEEETCMVIAVPYNSRCFDRYVSNISFLYQRFHTYTFYIIISSNCIVFALCLRSNNSDLRCSITRENNGSISVVHNSINNA